MPSSWQKWGTRFFFLNPPDNNEWSVAGKSKRISVSDSGVHPRLHLIKHQLFFPFIFKFHARFVFDQLMRLQIADILSHIKARVDIVWSFDIGNLYPLSNFPHAFKVFHPVDEPRNIHGIRAAENADILFAVTNEIVSKYSDVECPKYCINHGVADYFFRKPVILNHNDSSIRIGMAGNLLRPDIDWVILLKIINDNPQIRFEIWGTCTSNSEDVGQKATRESCSLIKKLQSLTNVFLHGAVPSDQLAEQLHFMDGFLICYDVQKDQSKGTNYHKVMEYLSTGKVIISSNISAYNNQPDLVQMVSERASNKDLPVLFKTIVENISRYNTPTLMKKRIQYACDNRYSNQLAKLFSFISAKAPGLFIQCTTVFNSFHSLVTEQI